MKPDCPDCATPRPADLRGSSAVSGSSVNPVRGNERRNVAGTGEESPEIVPDQGDTK